MPRNGCAPQVSYFQLLAETVRNPVPEVRHALRESSRFERSQNTSFERRVLPFAGSPGVATVNTWLQRMDEIEAPIDEVRILAGDLLAAAENAKKEILGHKSLQGTAALSVGQSYKDFYVQ